MNNFHYPVLSRIDLGICRSPGPGLGNLLFPISRALIGQVLHGGGFVYPTMRQIKIGPVLRGERDRRTYGDILRDRSRTEWRSWLLARGRPSVSEVEFDGSRQDATVRYQGLGRYFHDLQGHEPLIRRWLIENARRRDSAKPFDIGIHVRLGDFAAADPESSGNSVRQSFNWYRAAFEEARRISGAEAPSVVLFTDSDPRDVERELAIGPLVADRSDNALAAIMRMSRARVLIASRSTFSMWAAYLGAMPVIWDRRYDDRTRSFPLRPTLDHMV